jgi:hypothetical protein
MLNMKMNLRKEIEALAVWYVPVVIATIIASSLLTGRLNELIKYEDVSVGTMMSFMAAIPSLIGLADNLVVGIWLYLIVKGEDGRSVLWFSFGLFAHLFAAIAYICLKLYELQAFNE